MLYVRESATQIMQMIRQEQNRQAGRAGGA